MHVKTGAHFLLAGVMLFMNSYMGSVQAAPAELTKQLLSAPWHGSYVCNQGLTRLSLTLRPLSGGDGNLLEAEFAFSGDPDNPSVPPGSFRLTGSLHPASGLLVLKKDRWLVQPADLNYHMVDMEGRLLIGEGQAMIRGRVTTYGCQDFAVWQFFTEAASGR